MKIGIVGCGKVAELHAATITSSQPDSGLCFCDRNEHKAVDLANRFSAGSAVYTDFATMLNEERPDTVHVLTQIGSHVPLAIEALEGGAHVYVEKPVTQTVAEFDALLDVARRADRHLFVGYSALGTPVVQEARSLIASGSLGPLISAHCDYNWAVGGGGIPYGGGDHWAYSLRGGILQNLADHPASLVLDVVDSVDDYSVTVLRREDLPQSSPDLMHAVASNSRQIVSFTMSFGHGNTHAQITYCLEGATIEVDLRLHVITVREGDGPQSLPQRLLANTKSAWDIGVGGGAYAIRRMAGRVPREPGVIALIKNFYALIDNDAESLVPVSTTRHVVGLLEEAWESIPVTQSE